jgi:hypothetical protein
MNESILLEIIGKGGDFARAQWTDEQFIGSVWQTIAGLVRLIPPTGATIKQLVDATGLSINTVTGYLRALESSDFPIWHEEQRTHGTPYVFFVNAKQVCWLVRPPAK